MKDQIFGRVLTGNPIQDAKTLKSIGQTSKALRDFVAEENFDPGNPSASSRVAKYSYYNKELIEAGQLARKLYQEVTVSRYYGNHLIKHAPDAVGRIEAMAPILKFQPSDVKSRLVRDICELSEGAAYSARKVKSLTALGPHLDAFDAEDRQTLISQAAQLAKNNNGNHSTWDAITAMGGYLKERAPQELGPLGLGPLMDSRPELRQRLEDSIGSAHKNSAVVAVGDQNSVSRQNQNNTGSCHINRVEVGFASTACFRQSQSSRCSTAPSHRDDGGGWHLLSGWSEVGRRDFLGLRRSRRSIAGLLEIGSPALSAHVFGAAGVNSPPGC